MLHFELKVRGWQFFDIFKQSRANIINHKFWINKISDFFKVNLNDDLMNTKLFCEIEFLPMNAAKLPNQVRLFVYE